MYKLVLRLNQGILSTVRSCKFLVLDGMEDSEYVGTERTSAKEVATAFKNGIWALLMPVIILGGIYSGLFTPTEAAAIAVFYGIIVSAFVYRNMGMKDFLHVLSASASSTASILFLVANAHIFSYLLSSEQIPQKLAILMTSLTTNPTIIMFLIMIVLLIAGCFLDNAVAVILLTPHLRQRGSGHEHRHLLLRRVPGVRAGYRSGYASCGPVPVRCLRYRQGLH